MSKTLPQSKRMLLHVAVLVAAFFFVKRTLLPFKTFRWDVLLWLLFGLTLVYVWLAVELHSPRPFAPILSDSMEPWILKGDLVLIKSIHPSKIREKNVIVFRTEIPGRDSVEIAHRVVRVEKDPAAGLIFWTKGDNREQMDGFGNPASAVRGIVVRRVPMLGYLLMYSQSPPGWIFMGLTIFFYLIYRCGGRVVEKLKKWDPGRTDPALLERMDRQDETLKEFKEAMREYAEHLKTHTSILQGTRDATGRLANVAEKLDSSVEKLTEDKKSEESKYRPWKWTMNMNI